MWNHRRKQFLFNIGNLVVIGIIAVAAALMPRFFLDTLGVSSDYLPVWLVSAVLVSGVAFLWIALLLGRFCFRRIRSVRRLPQKIRGTATVEFMLVLPVTACMVLTVFAVAEIAHAQLVFRYAAFSAARAGAVEDYVIDKGWKSFAAIFSAIGAKNIYEYGSKNAKTRTDLAAKFALAGIDNGLVGGKSDAAAQNFGDILGALKIAEVKVGANNLTPWTSGDFFKRRVGTAGDSSRLTSKTDLFTAGEVPGDLSSFVAEIKKIVDDLAKKITDALTDLVNPKDVDSGSGVIAKLLGKILKPLVDKVINNLIKPLMNKVIAPILDFFKKIAGKIDGYVNQLFSPPEIQIDQQYQLRFRAGSLFWLITRADAVGERWLKLKRNDALKSKDETGLPPLRLQTSGAKVDMPMIPPLIYAVQIMVGDCTFPTKEDKKDGKEKKK